MLTQEEMMFLYRDMMTALDVGKKAEMGYYDVEFNTFGCTYFDGQERNYSISSSAAKLYDLLENAALEDIYPTMLLEATFKKPIPRGFKELLEFDLKLDLAKKMQQDFSIDFLQALQALAHALKQNNASDLLNTYMDSLECSFQRDKLNLFENTLCLTVSQQKLSLKDYALLLKRLDEELDTISTELRPHDIFNQAFYAFAYETGGRRNYFYDARKDFVYQKRYTLECTGVTISPLFCKTCFYNYEYRLTDARQDFVHSLPFIFDDAYFQLLHNIKSLPVACTTNEYLAIQNDFLRQYGTITKETMQLYGYRWQILKNL